jgi:NAD(P)-dependent dehydrogenase (short-subunit alcohol dehydrogenase family)
VNNKVAIVTGSRKGIGKAIVMAFARSKEYSGIVVNARTYSFYHILHATRS